MLIVVKSMVKNARVPIEVTCPDNMRENLPFIVSIGANSDVGKTTHNVERVNIVVKSSNALQAARNLDRVIVNIILVQL
jgi:DNA polymerase IIIc chi subunit